MSQVSAITDPRYAERLPIFEDLFSDAITPQTAAIRLATTHPDENPAHGCEQVGDLTIHLARLRPEHQERLVALLVAITKLPEAHPGDDALSPAAKTRWSRLPDMDMDFNYQWNGLTLKPFNKDPRTRSEIATEFVNVNTFSARLMALPPPRILDLELCALWTFRDALETPWDQQKSRAWLQMHICAAAEWVFVAGRQVYGWETEFPHGGVHGRPGGGGPLWDGMHGFCKERWGLWRERFGEVAGMGRFEEGVRERARRAGGRMGEIEGEVAGEGGEGR